MMYQKKSNPAAYLKIILPLVLMISMAFVITSQDGKIDRELAIDSLKLPHLYNQKNKLKENPATSKHRVLPININSTNIDLFVGDRLMIPNIDYTYNPKTGEAKIINNKYSSSYWLGASAYAIDKPRERSYFDNYNSQTFYSIDFIGVSSKPNTFLILRKENELVHQNNVISIDDIKSIVNDYNIDQLKVEQSVEYENRKKLVEEINHYRSLDNSVIAENTHNSAYIASCKKSEINKYACSVHNISSYLSQNIIYSDELIKTGFEGSISFNITIDKKGNPTSISQIISHANPDELLAGNEDYYFDLVRKNFKFIPATLNSEKIESNLFVNVSYKIPANKKKLVPTKDSKTNPNNQLKSYINYISNKGFLAYRVVSDWNVPAHIEITDPTGTLIHKCTIDYIYKEEGAHFFIPNKVNGTYKIKVTQDGQTVETEFLCEVF